MTTKTMLIALLLAGACSGAMASSPPPSRADEPHEPNLCSLLDGAYCTPCGTGPGLTIQCSPEALEGWLCCAPSGSPCVAVVSPDQCETGVWGWCSNYTTKDVNGVEVAVCEDPQ